MGRVRVPPFPLVRFPWATQSWVLEDLHSSLVPRRGQFSKSGKGVFQVDALKVAKGHGGLQCAVLHSAAPLCPCPLQAGPRRFALGIRAVWGPTGHPLEVRLGASLAPRGDPGLTRPVFSSLLAHCCLAHPQSRRMAR